MAGKLDVYNLGEKGVILTKSPVHGTDGELLYAQNAQPNPEGGLSGIRKRLGMARVNSVVAGGAIYAMVNVPLEDPGVGGAPPAGDPLFFFVGAVGPLNEVAYKSPNAIDWSYDSESIGLTPPLVSKGCRDSATGYCYWSSYGASENKVLKWDGLTFTESAALWLHDVVDGGINYGGGQVVDLTSDADGIFVLVSYSSLALDVLYRIYKVEWDLSAATQVGDDFHTTSGSNNSDVLGSIVSWNGALWVSGNHQKGAVAPIRYSLKVWSVAKAGGAWSEDLEEGGTLDTNSVGGVWLEGRGTNLLLCADGVSSGGMVGHAAPPVKTRTPAGVWATATTLAGYASVGGATYAKLDELMYWERSADFVTATLYYSDDGGATWASIGSDAVGVPRPGSMVDWDTIAVGLRCTTPVDPNTEAVVVRAYTVESGVLVEKSSVTLPLTATLLGATLAVAP